MVSGTLSVKQGMIVAINRTKWTCSVKFDSGVTQEDVAIAPIYLNKNGNGIYYMPEIDSMVLMAEVGDKQFLLGTSYPIDESKPFESADDTANEEDLAPAHNALRPTGDPGDYTFTTRGGGFINMKSSGLIEVGASQISRRVYIPINNFIRDLCQSYQLNTAGGNLDFLIRDGDSSHGSVTEMVNQNPSNPNDVPQEISFFKSPVEFNLNIKEFAEDENDTIQVSMGRLVENDGDNSRLLGSPGKDFNSSVVFRCSIADRFTYFIDKFGTVVHTVSGSASFSYRKSVRMVIGGGKVENVKGQRNIKSLDEVKEVKNRVSHTIGNDKTENIKGAYSTTIGKGRNVLINGERLTTVRASSVDEVEGSRRIGTTGDRVDSTTGNLLVSVSEKTTATYADDVKISMLSGDYMLSNALGSIDFKSSLGKSSLSCLAVSEIAVTPTKAFMSYAGGSEVQANITGVGMQSSGGAISVDLIGTTRIGANAGAPGYVITTGTNPVCFVTGLPLLGAANVVVNASAPVPFLVPPIPSIYEKN
jgi:hypothetical protein